MEAVDEGEVDDFLKGEVVEVAGEEDWITEAPCATVETTTLLDLPMTHQSVSLSLPGKWKS